MDIEYGKVIDFSVIKELVRKKRTTISYLAEDVGISQSRMSSIIKGSNMPSTALLAKIAFVLKVPVSEVVRFDIKPTESQRKWFEEKVIPETEMKEGLVSYEPLRIMMQMYLTYYNDRKNDEKTVNDLFDKIEPYRRRNGMVNIESARYARLGVEARFGEGYKAEKHREYKAKGLTPETRTKLKNDVSLNIRTIYDLCKFFGCSVDWVMSYK